MKTGIYEHYKGKQYEVLGTVIHSETDEKLVLYKALYDCPDLEEEYGAPALFVRPYDMFNERIEIDGQLVPRFTYISEVLNS